MGTPLQNREFVEFSIQCRECKCLHFTNNVHFYWTTQYVMSLFEREPNLWTLIYTLPTKSGLVSHLFNKNLIEWQLCARCDAQHWLAQDKGLCPWPQSLSDTVSLQPGADMGGRIMSTTHSLALAPRFLQLVPSSGAARGQNLKELCSVDHFSREKIPCTTHSYLLCFLPLPKPKDFPVKIIPIAPTFKIKFLVKF